MDDIDMAQANDEKFRQAALRAHFGVNGITLGEGMDGLHLQGAELEIPVRSCCDCGDEIETARLEANPAAIRCIFCQQKRERR